MGTCAVKSELGNSTIKASKVSDHHPTRRRQNVRLSTAPMHRGKLEDTVTNPLSQPEGPQQRGEKGVIMISERLTVQGSLSSSVQSAFDDKEITVSMDSIQLEQLSSLGIGVTCKKGLKPGVPNQDDFAVIIDPEFTIFCVFDGHGTYGHLVSNYVKRHLPENLIKNPNFSNDLATALSDAFVETNESLKQHCENNEDCDCQYSGTTATVGLIKDNQLYIAHVGDSRAVIGVKAGAKYMPTRLTVDHKPNHPLEQERVLASNGEIRRLEDDIPYRIFTPGMEVPGLSISRAIGDTEAQKLGVIAVPEVTSIEINRDTEYLILASDGVWEFVSDHDAVSTISRFGNKCKLASEKLATLSWTRWIQNEEDLADDISVIVVYLPWQDHCTNKSVDNTSKTYLFRIMNKGFYNSFFDEFCEYLEFHIQFKLARGEYL